MKISLDKEYQTRDGREVRIYAIDGSGACPIHGAIKCVDGSWTSRQWGSSGRIPLDPYLNPADIIEKPKTTEVDFWVNIYPNGGYGCTERTRTKADHYAGPKRIACINIKRIVTEGEGL